MNGAELFIEFNKLCDFYAYNWTEHDQFLRGQLILVLKGDTGPDIGDNFIALASKAKKY